jgi:hypothetical protein
MAEWTMATVLKTAVALEVTGGSTPSPSASDVGRVTANSAAFAHKVDAELDN